MALLQRGLRGEPVKRLQQALNIEADGAFGAGTDKALRDYQASNGLAVDGIAGPDTFSELGLYELIILHVGSRGECVKKLQQQLNLGADGIFGNGTKAAVEAFQQANGLDADGVVGPDTLAKMDLFSEIDDAVVAKSKLPTDFKMPETPAAIVASASDDDNQEVPAAVAEIAEKAQEKGSIWGSIKGMFG